MTDPNFSAAPYAAEIQFALQAVRRAARLVRQVQAELVTPALTKGDRSPVTVADFASQALVGCLLSQSFPEDGLVAEEDSEALRQPDEAATLEQVARFVKSELPQATPEAVCAWIDHARVDSARRFWTLDPIDGTKGFLRGDQYAVALALVVAGQVQVGVLGCPNLVGGSQPDLYGPGSLVVAVRGQGTWTTPLTGAAGFERLLVSGQIDPAQARLLRSFESGHTNVSQIDVFAQALGIQAAPVRMDSQAKYAVLAAGEGDLLLRLLSPEKPDYREKIWDQAAGSLVLEEAGGCISDLDGKALDFSTGRALVNNRGILASNYRLHDLALQALKNIGA
ncbi:MAG: 3'(2'),5'-bisphosphate nucleotidase [Anaerolineales bacterium]|nr:3'(2'),5'-bisphosphate nucleotidase [Anaerolineales bacterium]